MKYYKMMTKFVRYIQLGIIMTMFLLSAGYTFAQPLPSPAPEPPSPSVSTPSPPKPTDEPGITPYPYYGCGGSGQSCCQELQTYGDGQMHYKCFFKDDRPAFYDKQGAIINGDISSQRSLISSCTCQPQETKDSNGYDMCRDYFSPSKRAEVVNPGLWPNGKRDLSAQDIQALNDDLAACSQCVASKGVYTAIGCVPYNLDGIVQVLLQLGIALGGILALLCLVYSAIRIQLSKGDPGVMGKARESAIACIAGLILMLFSAFITNIFIGDLLGFGAQQPLKNVTQDKNVIDGLMCNRRCIYSEASEKGTRCFQGACSDKNPECGKPKAGGVVPINSDCKFAPQCGNFKEVPCP